MGLHTHFFFFLVVTLNLTINQAGHIIQMLQHVIVILGTSHCQISGTYSNNFINCLCCDSILVLNLTINNSDTSYTNVTACDSFIWQGN